MTESFEELDPAANVNGNGDSVDNKEIYAIDLQLPIFDKEIKVGLSNFLTAREKPSSSGPNNSLRLKNDLMKIATDQVENFRKYRTLGNKIFDGVAKIIKQKENSNFKVSRQLIAGSMGKNTSLGYDFEPDFDVIFFIRDLPSISDLRPVRDEIHSLLKEKLPFKFSEWTGGNFRNRFLKKLKYGIMLTFPADLGSKRVTIKFDIHLAYAFSENVDEQTRLTLRKIRQSKNPRRNWYIYSSSLSEKTVKFVREQSQFTQYVIRLAKLWGKNIAPKEFISGKSSIMELVAIKAAQEADTNILTAYRRFLEYMAKFDQININFCDSYSIYQYSIPLILDSVNPYNNYATAIAKNRAYCNYLKNQAAETLTALAECENTKNYRRQLNRVRSFFARAGF